MTTPNPTLAREGLLSHLRTAVLMAVLLTVLLGIVYPLAMTGIAQVLFPSQANGSLVRDSSGNVIGSELLAQSFSRPEYFHPPPPPAAPTWPPPTSSCSTRSRTVQPPIVKRMTSPRTRRSPSTPSPPRRAGSTPTSARPMPSCKSTESPRRAGCPQISSARLSTVTPKVAHWASWVSRASMS
jgi:potassium-transporting ATPase KdpC subunit